MAGHLRLDLSQLNAEPPDLDLVIGASEAFETTIGKPPRQVAGPVESSPGFGGEGVRHESIRRQIRPFPVPPGQPDSTDVQLPAYAHGLSLQVTAQNPHLCIRNGTPDRYGPSIGRHPGDRRPHRCLGRPVHVPDVVRAPKQIACQLARQGLSSAQHLQAGRSLPP